MSDLEKMNEMNASGVNSFLKGTLQHLIDFMRKELIFRGILFLLLGLLMMFRPGQTLLAITIAVGVLVLIDGISMLISALAYQGKGKAFLILNAVLFILLGIVTCTAPLKMNVIWIIMIGFWQLFGGVHNFTMVRSAGASAVFSGLCGILSGLVLIFMPILGMLTLMWLMGLFSVINGCASIALGIRLKKAL